MRRFQMKTRFVVLLVVVITGRFIGGRRTTAARGIAEGSSKFSARRILGTEGGKETPDGTSEGTVSRFTSGYFPNGDTPRSGWSVS